MCTFIENSLARRTTSGPPRWKWNNDTIDLDRKEVLENIDLSLHCAVRIRRNDWVMNKNQISASYMEMLKNAQHEIIIMSSYFIPSNFIRMSMVQAINRGVKIKLILAAISDIGILIVPLNVTVPCTSISLTGLTPKSSHSATRTSSFS